MNTNNINKTRTPYKTNQGEHSFSTLCQNKEDCLDWKIYIMPIFVLLIFFFNFFMYHMSEIVFAEQPDQVNFISQWIVLTLLFFLTFTLYSLLIPKNDYVSRLAMKTINETIENWVSTDKYVGFLFLSSYVHKQQ